MKKNDLSALQENCFCFCDEEISREAPFQVPIDIPEGFTIDSAEAAATVTWSTDHLLCISEPCLIQTGPEPEDIGVRYAVSKRDRYASCQCVACTKSIWTRGRVCFCDSY